MNKISITVVICFLLGILLAACSPAATPTDTPTSPPTDTTIPPTPISSTPAPTFSPAGMSETQISIDGDPTDWAGYDILITDPAGDQQGGEFDIAAVRAFANDQFLYVLVETHSQRGDYVQLDLEVKAGGRKFVITFNPERGESAFMGDVSGDQFVPIGEVAGSISAAGEAVEFKMPLSSFEDTTGLTLRNVRPMTGECCDADWRAIDEINPVPVAQLDEVEPVSEIPTKPQVCASDIAPPAPFGMLDPAPIELAELGYTAEWFVAPGVFNMPQEVFLTPEGNLLVYAVRGHTLSRVAADGTVSLMAEEVYAYLGDMDSQGNLYLHFHPGGRVTRISPDGTVTRIVESPEIQTACDSGFGIGPDGNMYLALNPCSNRSDLFQITPAGQFTRLMEGIEPLQALRTAPDGRFLAASCNQAFELSLDDYSLTSLGSIPARRCVSPGGLAVDDAGNIYLSTGARSPDGEVYRIDYSGETTLLAEIPINGLSGIEWLPSSSEVVGGQLRQGGLIAVGLDGTLREIVPGNGIITPMGIGFSPCGELAVPNDDGGMMTLIDPAGKVSWFMDYLSFIPPIPFVAFEPDGTMYASEAAPGLFPLRVAIVPPGGIPKTLIEADFPSGLARRSDGILFVSETGAGRITRVDPDGSTAVVAEGLNFPQALALDADSNLYAVVGKGYHVLNEVFPVPAHGDTVIRISPDGGITTLVSLKGVAGLAIDPEGGLFVSAGGDVRRISPDGNVSHFASGFHNSIGLAFDLAGNLYVSDEHQNGIVRIGGFPQGTLRGVVTDPDGIPVEGARVQVLSDHPIVVGQVVMTNADGQFSLPAAPRTYSVIVNAEGYEAATLEDVEIIADQDTEVEIELEG